MYNTVGLGQLKVERTAKKIRVIQSYSEPR